MGFARRARMVARRPVRTSVRRWQARHPRLAVGDTGPPDFVGIGAQRCGTSWWHSLIEQHPRVAPLGWGVKELHYFDDQWGGERRPAADYAAHFRRRAGFVSGEWTPRYLWDPWAVPALLEVAPAAKLLVVLRDPVARFRSGVRHAAKLSGEPTADDVSAAFGRGLYAEQLEPVLEAVGPQQLLVLQFEQCVREPSRFLDQTFEFLQLDPFRPAGKGERNEAVAPDVQISSTLTAAARRRYAGDAARLAALFPGAIDLDLWPGVSAQPGDPGLVQSGH